MDAVGGDVDAFAGLADHVVHADQGDEGAVILGGVLRLQAGEEIEDVGMFGAVVGFREGAEALLCRDDELGVGFEEGFADGLQGVFGEGFAGVDAFGDEVAEGLELEEGVDVLEGFEGDEDFELAESDGNFGLVVGVRVFVWILFVELFG